MRHSLRSVTVDEPESQRLMSERDDEDDRHQALRAVDRRLERVHQQRDGQPAPTERDVYNGAVQPRRRCG